MKVARDLLPEAAAQRHSFLRTYFCDKDAQVVDAQDGWDLQLEWPGDEARHVDPKLTEGLAWWGQGLKREGMWQARRRSGKILTALYDTWTLHSWSEWLEKQGRVPERLVILHVDDHRDLGSPRLVIQGGGLVDPITGAKFDIRSPDSVLGSVTSGALGMGSFMTPFLHAFPQVEVRHLCQPPKVRSSQSYGIELTSEVDVLLAPGQARPAIRLMPLERQGPGTYSITCDVDQWVAGLHGCVALLHVDMDYFNNRYDGDSDWNSRAETLDADATEIALRVDEVVRVLASSAAVVEDAVLALSPGFFPAELWAQAHERLHGQLLEIL